MNFDSLVADVKARQGSRVAEVKRSLEPTKRELERIWTHYMKEKPALLATLAKAQAAHQQAVSVGVCHSDLQRILAELHGDGYLPGVVRGLDANYQNAVAQIDNLTEANLNMRNVILALPGEPQRLRASIGAMKRLIERAAELTKEGGELHHVLMAAARRPPSPTTGSTVQADSPGGVAVKSAFPV
jgi:hypothetical protein